MSLCFAEVVILAILSIISKYIGEDIFYLIFLLSIISTAVINFQIIKRREGLNYFLYNYRLHLILNIV